MESGFAFRRLSECCATGGVDMFLQLGYVNKGYCIYFAAAQLTAIKASERLDARNSNLE